MPRTIAHSKKDGRSPQQKQAEFLEYFCESANVSSAARQAKIGRRTVYDWIDNDPDFFEEYEKANKVALGVLEDEATRRAVEGVDKPVFYKGMECGYVKEYSDTLMIVLLKARAPEKYKDRAQTELTGKGGKDLFTNMTEEEIDKRIKELLNDNS